MRDLATQITVSDVLHYSCTGTLSYSPTRIVQDPYWLQRDALAFE